MDLTSILALSNQGEGAKYAKLLDKTLPSKSLSKNAEATSFLFYSQPSTLPKEALSKFYLSTAFGLSLIIRSVASIRLSTSYTHILITKIGNQNLQKTII